MSIVYAKEKPLFRIAWAFSALCWFVLIVGTVGIGLFYIGLFALAYLFGQSAFISYLRGSAVKLGVDQMPELHQRFRECCERLRLDDIPDVYVLNAHGILNALATRFLRRYYVVLYSDIVDALADRPEALDFYLGHEIGHIKCNHVRRMAFLMPARVLPLIGSAYSRAREYTCDLHGLACCDDPKDAGYALAVLAAGERSWNQINLNRFAEQSAETGGFWMSFHELTGDYPWLTKRMKHVMSAAAGRPAKFPKRHPLAFGLAFMVPNFGGGAAMGNLMAVVAIIGILAAIAIPNFLRFQLKAKMSGVADSRIEVQGAATEYINSTNYLPSSLEQIGLPDPLDSEHVSGVVFGKSSITIQLQPELAAGVGGDQITLTPYMDQSQLAWECAGNLDDIFQQQACQEKASVHGGAADGASTGHAALEPGEQTCSDEFRGTNAYANLGAALQDELRQSCNTWKLEQVYAD